MGKLKPAIKAPHAYDSFSYSLVVRPSTSLRYELMNALEDKRVWTGWDVEHLDEERPSSVQPGLRLFAWEEDAQREEEVDASAHAKDHHQQHHESQLNEPLLDTSSRPSFDSGGLSPGEEETKDGYVQMRPPSWNGSDSSRYNSLTHNKSTGGSVDRAFGGGSSFRGTSVKNSTRGSSGLRKELPLTSTHLSGFRDWHGQGPLAVFVVQWAQSLREHGVKSNPFDPKILSFCNDDLASNQVRYHKRNEMHSCLLLSVSKDKFSMLFICLAHSHYISFPSLSFSFFFLNLSRWPKSWNCFKMAK